MLNIPEPFVLEAKGIEDTRSLAKSLARLATCGWLILLKGDLGSGKTTFSKAFIASLSSLEDREIQSPTYVYVNSYPSSLGLIQHFDLYRLEDEDSFFELGLDEYLDSGAISLIEWPECIETKLPKKRVELVFTYQCESQRLIELKFIDIV